MPGSSAFPKHLLPGSAGHPPSALYAPPSGARRSARRGKASPPSSAWSLPGTLLAVPCCTITSPAAHFHCLCSQGHVHRAHPPRPLRVLVPRPLSHPSGPLAALRVYPLPSWIPEPASHWPISSALPCSQFTLHAAARVSFKIQTQLDHFFRFQDVNGLLTIVYTVDFNPFL